MADSGGYWLNLAEAQKLTQSFLVPGVIEENVRVGGIMTMVPLVQSTGLDTSWNREKAERTASFINLGDKLVWTDNITHDKITVALKTIYDQTPLNNFVQSIYGTLNNYEAVTLVGMRKGAIKKLEDAIIYADLSFPAGAGAEFDGLHAMAEESANTTDFEDLDIDAGGGLAISHLRRLVDVMKYGIDVMLFPRPIMRQFQAFWQEIGSTVANRSAIGSFFFTPDAAGKPIPTWDGISLQKSDYLVAEEAGTGEGSDAKAKNTSGTKEYSIFGIKFGQVRQQEPGLSLGFGGAENELGQIFRMDRFDKLVDFDAAGLRVIGYCATMGGSKMAVGRIHGITDVAVVA